MKDRVLVANGQGFWGDSILGPVRLVREGPLDYLTLDYLAEVTMSILQKQKSRRPDTGYATDFVRMLDRLLPEIVAQGIKVVANAGGVNPQACVEAVLAVARKHGIKGLRVGRIEGDDVFGRIDELLAQGEELVNMDTGAPLKTIRPRITSANVYLGARPIVECLAEGAQIVVGGRLTDPSLVMGPLIHEFGWRFDDWDRMAAATVAGHIVECGAQCTGGNYADWRQVEDMARIGYPIVEGRPDGTFAIVKHDGTGGMVTVRTVTSQLVYEMGDPRRYIGPDCIADFTTIRLQEEGKDRVRVSGVRGYPATDTYKVSISYEDGFKCQGQLTVSGPDAVEKAELCARVVFERLALDGVTFAPEEKSVEILGTSVVHAGIAAPPQAPAEVVLRLGVKSADEDKCDRFGLEIVPLVTSGPPGVTGFAGGRPKAQEVIGFWPALLGKDRIETRVSVVES